jgi:putative FmdB family regulatory protein
MPIYEYRCEQGHTFDVMQRMSDDPVTSCEVCGAPVQRVFHPVAVHFKGSGFYNTDYGTRKRAREKEAGSGDGSKSGDGAKSGDSSKSDGGGSSSDSSSTSSDKGSKSQSKAAASGD